ncbi:MAG TPA: amidohydrolase family protein [Cyclobacteriaceae bacterium]|nr:amidohydrolase family protein [Cyclobacteriaceae bacterium]
MKRLTIIFLLTLSTYSFCQQNPIDSQAQEIVLQMVDIVPMDSERILTDQTVIIRDNRIVAIGPKLKHDKNALVINADGKYLIPGLAEMHAHIPTVDDLEPIKEVLFLFAANGITTIRGMLGHPKHLEVREMINKGEILGPHLFTTGPAFSGSTVRTAQEAEQMVRDEKAAGYDYLKLLPGLNDETFRAIVKTAREVGIPFVGHVSYEVGIWKAIDANYSSIDHLDGFIEGIVPGIENIGEQQVGLFGMFVADRANAGQIPKLMKGLSEHHIWVVPTQALAERWFSPEFTAEKFMNDRGVKYMKKEMIDQWLNSKQNLIDNPQYDPVKMENFIKLRRKLIKACQDNDVGLLLGSDAPQVFNVPGFSAHSELEYLVRSGLTPYEALKTGTVNVATYLNKPDAGVIRVGAPADLVLISGNPLINITETQNIEGVMLNGKWLSEEYIDAQLKKLEK